MYVNWLFIFQWQEYLAGQHLDEYEEGDVDINCPHEDLDEASSEVVTLNTPLKHEVIQFEWLHCRYSKRGSNKSASVNRDSSHGNEEGGPGTIVARYVK